MTARYPRGTAYHEAGHAVVAWSLGLQVRGVRVSDEDASGGAEIGGADRLSLVDHISLCAAGYAAERVFDCRTHELAGFNDRLKIMELITRSGKSEEEYGPALRDEGYERARELLVRHERKVNQLAGQLVEHGYVDAADFLHMMAAD